VQLQVESKTYFSFHRRIVCTFLSSIVVLLFAGCSTFHVPSSGDRVAGDLPAGWTPVSWEQLPNWQSDNVSEAWGAFLKSCGVLVRQPTWSRVCEDARDISVNTSAVRRFMEVRFVPHRYEGSSAQGAGLMTGYYEPLFDGSRRKTGRFRYPLYAAPADLIRLKPAAKTPGSRARRDASGRTVPYWSRQEIEAGKAEASLDGNEIAYLEHPIDVLTAHIQGSLRVRLEDGSELRLGYADGNGHPYKSIGRFMIDQGWITWGQASMQGIRAWLDAHPEKVSVVLAANPSYVFFRELPAVAGEGPLGSMGIPLTARRSIAVDPSFVPLGAPVYVSGTMPDHQPLRRLVMAQDVGSAIIGAQRADFFWGSGESAGAIAGRSKSPVTLWLLWPRS
jgi:membrane-bound lytic murein transglycosylase A